VTAEDREDDTDDSVEGRPGQVGRPGPGDPLGRRALFWVPVDQTAAPAKGRRQPLGKHAFYSNARATASSNQSVIPENPLADRGPLVVECSSCCAISRIGVLDFLLFQFPLGFWFPRGRFDRRMTCPSCRKRVWASVTVRWRQD
jgi:hypothetical protein